jgi:hypothetical protein
VLKRVWKQNRRNQATAAAAPAIASLQVTAIASHQAPKCKSVKSADPSGGNLLSGAYSQTRKENFGKRHPLLASDVIIVHRAKHIGDTDVCAKF